MKVILFAITVLASTIAHANGKAGDVFYVKNVKQQICETAFDQFRNLNIRLQACLDEKMFFAKDKVSIKISGVKKPLTTLMEVTFETMGIGFEAGVKAVLEVSPKGVIRRTGWEISYLNPQEFTNGAILRNTWENDENAVQLEFEELSKKLFKKMEQIMKSNLLESVNIGAENMGGSVGDDIELNTMEDGRKILNLKTGEVLGYLFAGDAASESGDVKIFTTYKFDLKGDLIDYSQWSGGYHE